MLYRRLGLLVLVLGLGACSSPSPLPSETGLPDSGEPAEPVRSRQPEASKAPLPVELPAADLSAALGFANLGNTCFANSALKVLLYTFVDRPEQLLAWLEQDLALLHPTDNPTVQKARDGLQQALSTLIRDWFDARAQLLDRTKPVPPSDGFQSQLHGLFDAVDAFRLASTGNRCTVDSQGELTCLRKDQEDTQSFLIEVLDALDYGSFFTGFRIVVSQSSPDGTVEKLLSSPGYMYRYAGDREITVAEALNNNNEERFFSTSNPLFIYSNGVVPSAQVALDLYDQEGKHIVDHLTMQLMAGAEYRGTNFSGHWVAWGYDPAFQRLSPQGGWLLHNDSRVSPHAQAEAFEVLNKNKGSVLGYAKPAAP